jgi:hypothetical protein
MTAVLSMFVLFVTDIVDGFQIAEYCLHHGIPGFLFGLVLCAVTGLPFLVLWARR